jgi:hypothetical protein
VGQACDQQQAWYYLHSIPAPTFERRGPVSSGFGAAFDTARLNKKKNV